jgi:hypothetical protein
MPVNTQSVGIDYTLTFYDTVSGAAIDLNDVQSVKITAAKHEIVSRPYNSVPKFGFIPDGYRFAFAIVRTDENLEAYQLAQENLFYSGAPSKAGYMNETIQEADGSVSRYQYTGFVMWVDEIGDFTRESNVKMQCVGYASKKVQIA